MVLTIRDTLLWYKRLDVRTAMVGGAARKEIGVRFEDAFGKRPDAIEYEQEVLAAVQRGATSFHASEELWNSPLAVETGMTRERANELRVGWDLVLDIDFTDFAATKLITAALCDELERHGITTYGIKFSGNKGFHIGVAWESFPAAFDGQPLAPQFPDVPRRIADYLVYMIDNPDTEFALSEKIRILLGPEGSAPHLKRVCASCGRDRFEKVRNVHFVCSRCNHQETLPADNAPYLICKNCSSVMERVEHKVDTDTRCVCGATETREKLDLKIDTQLIASRHLYRLEYSMHEKSKFISIPIARAALDVFKREDADPARIGELTPFWYRAGVDGQGYRLLVHSMAHAAELESGAVTPREIIWDGDAAPVETFPPTITKMLAGMKDGKKRGLFILTNFLASVGWNPGMIEEELLAWNKRNDPSLRESEIRNHLRYHAQKASTVLPPNFMNPIYRDLGVLVEDELTQRCKNPVQYVRMKLKQLGPKPKEETIKEPKKKKSSAASDQG